MFARIIPLPCSEPKIMICWRTTVAGGNSIAFCAPFYLLTKCSMLFLGQLICRPWICSDIFLETLTFNGTTRRYIPNDIYIYIYSYYELTSSIWLILVKCLYQMVCSINAIQSFGKAGKFHVVIALLDLCVGSSLLVFSQELNWFSCDKLLGTTMLLYFLILCISYTSL
jgi:hypothetical protein